MAALTDKQMVLVGGTALVGGALLIWFLSRQAKAVAATAGGLITGDNALTAGTPYQGAGVLGTLGAGFNAASGGFFQSAGETLGGWAYDLFGDDPLAADMVKK